MAVCRTCGSLMTRWCWRRRSRVHCATTALAGMPVTSRWQFFASQSFVALQPHKRVGARSRNIGIYKGPTPSHPNPRYWIRSCDFDRSLARMSKSPRTSQLAAKGQEILAPSHGYQACRVGMKAASCQSQKDLRTYLWSARIIRQIHSNRIDNG